MNFIDIHCLQKNKAREFLAIILFRTDEIFKNKIRTTYSRVYSGHNCSGILNEARVTPLNETFYLNEVLQN